MKVEVASKDLDVLGQSLYWDVPSQTLFWSNTARKEVKRLNPKTKEESVVKTAETVAMALPRKNGKGLLISQRNRLDFLDYETGQQTPFVSKETFGIPDGQLINDGKCDPLGRLWVGTMAPVDGQYVVEWPHIAALYMVTPDGKVQQKLDKVGLGNGMDWTTDHKTYVFCDSAKCTITAYDFDKESGNISNPRQVLHFPEPYTTGNPDGMTLDSNNNIWVTMFKGGKVVQYDLQTGKEMQTISLAPTTNITCANFGGPNLDEMYMTSARIMIEPSELPNQPNAGSLFRATGLGVRGKEPFPFGG